MGMLRFFFYHNIVILILLKALSKQEVSNLGWDAHFFDTFQFFNQLPSAKKGSKNDHPKAVTYDEWLKWKRDTRQKSSLFLRKRTAFLLGISLYFRLFVAHYGFNKRLSRLILSGL